MNPLLAQFHEQLRVQAEAPGYVREQTEYVVRHVSQCNEAGFIIASNINEETAANVIEHELRYFKQLQQPFEWKLYSYDAPSHLHALLEEYGFTKGEQEALMVLTIHEHSPLLQQKTTPIVKELQDEQGIADVAALEERIWGESKDVLKNRLWRDKQAAPHMLHVYGVYVEDKLVSAAWMYFEPNASFASLWGGSTLEGYRRNGYYSLLLAARVQKAFTEGYPYVTVDASSMSEPILQKHGFERLTYTYGFDSPK